MSRTQDKTKPSQKDSRRCDCGKLRFRDKTEAVDALHRIQNKAQLAMVQYGTTRRPEARSYLCAICSGYHLTSQIAPTLGDWKVAA